MTLTEFLLARIAEDEAFARTAMGDGDGWWASWNRPWDDGQHRDLAVDGVRLATLPTSIDEHVCRHDPARVLAECAAKRKIIAECRSTKTPVGYSYLTLTYLALPYADHPDYLPEWRV